MASHGPLCDYTHARSMSSLKFCLLLSSDGPLGLRVCLIVDNLASVGRSMGIWDLNLVREYLVLKLVIFKVVDFLI